MELVLQLVLLVAAVAMTSGLAERVGVPAPLLLVVVGIGASFLPVVPDYRLDPEVVLVGILPPLLYAAAIRTSVLDLRRDRRPIGLLSIGLVACTCVVVGLVTWWVVPGLPLAAGFALGAVVAPPDAVAASAVARRVRMPRRIVSILEGESLINDATALVALRVSLAGLAGGVTAWDIGREFAVAAGGGVAVGVAVAAALVWLRRRVRDVVLDTTLSLLAPFVAFLAAEELSVGGAHPSGVLAVVITGLALGHRSGELQSASSRLAEQVNWRSVQFVLEGAVFLLIGLQLRSILEAAGDTDLGWARLSGICVAVFVTTVIVRLVWVYPATYLPRWLVGSIRRNDPAPRWTVPLVLGWAGMRGVVTLAAVLSLPLDVPQRPALVLAAFAVVAGTLLVQGSTLPWVVRRLRLPAPDPAEDALAEAAALQAAARAGLARLDELADGVPDEVLAQLRSRPLDRANVTWERLGARAGSETPSATYRRVRVEMLSVERAELVRQRREGRLDEQVLQLAQRQLDVEESFLEQLNGDFDEGRDADPLRSRATVSCEHLDEAQSDVGRPDRAVCARCVAEGTTWVHLRRCVECGTVACCDSSPRRHAAAHFQESRHPVMRSIEPGEAWRWCYVDELLG